MKWINKTLLIVFIIFGVNGCSDKQIENSILHAEIAISGYKAPKFFHFSNVNDANHYMFHQKDFEIMMPQAKKNDWIEMEGWDGLFINGKDNGFAVGLDQKVATSKGGWISYHISVSSSIGKYTEEDKQLELANNEFFKKKYKKRVYDFGHGHKETSRINVHLKHFGKENYPCFVSEIRDETINKFGEKTVKYKIFYRCYKFNSSRTKSKSVIITLTYTKNPNLPAKYKTLAKEYTYADLKRRARRMLDSLYIKDGW